MNSQSPPLRISSLPNELLIAIAAAGQEGRVVDLPAVFKTEWIMSQLSRRFRDVIVGVPGLWTIIEASLDALGSMEILKLYLERSEPLEISVTLQHLARRSSASRARLEMIERLCQIVPYLNRIWRLSIKLRSVQGDLALAPFRDVAAPNLRHLEIANVHDESSNRPVEMFLSGAPRLAFVTMDSFIPFPVPAWTAALTHLECRGDHPDQEERLARLVAITTPARSLVHLHLDLHWLSTAESRFDIPSLKSLHIFIADGEDELYLLHVVDLFDAPALTEFVIDGTHGDQASVLLNSTNLPHSSFPALSSLFFVNRHNNSCSCEADISLSHRIISPPLQLFPALSSLGFINQCFTSNLVEDILGPNSQPWPLLKTITLGSREGTSDVRGVLRDAVRSKRQWGQALPTFRLSPTLFLPEDWQNTGANVELFDPDDVLSAFCR